MYDAIIISDTHIGSQLCEADALYRFLSNLEPTKQLIINGDLIENSKVCFKWFNLEIFRLLKWISRRLPIIWVKGNHDENCHMLSCLTDCVLVYNYQFTSGSKEFYCTHGDGWDSFINNHPVLTWLSDKVFGLLQRLDKSHKLAIYTKHKCKTFIHCASHVKESANTYRKENNLDFIVCGHTHFPEMSDGYINCGSWTEKPCTYVTVKKGVPELRVYE